MRTTRRWFLGNAANSLALLFASALKHRAASTMRQLTKDDIANFRIDLLELVNSERLSAGESVLVLDDLASLVADQHAHDMATGKFLSHWGSDGRKPYQRYGDLDGFHAVQENVSAATNIESTTAKYTGITLARMHMKMYAEAPPADGHRRTILAPQHTHVGFGIALADRELRLAELYVGKHIHLEPFPRQAKRKAIVQLRGRLLEPGYKLSYAEVFFEPRATSPGMDWLREPRPYSLPDEFRTIRPVAPEQNVYADGVTGEIEVAINGRFRIPVYLFKREPGVYTVVIWLSELRGRKKFEATNIVIHAD